MTSAASSLEPFVTRLLGPRPPVTIRFWDGSTLGAGDTTIHVRSPEAVRHLVWAPGELGLGRAYVSGALDLDGDIYDLLTVRDHLAGSARDDAQINTGWRGMVSLLPAAWRLRLIGRRPPIPPEEARLTGRIHSKARDAAAIRHHYDVSNDFYRIVLGETMTYSCAYFRGDDMSLDDAQTSKYELICQKLGLQPGMRLLDVGCGWGGMVLHAAQHHGVQAVGITLSPSQQERAAKRIAAAGLEDRIEVRVQDYRDIDDGPYDAISSIGMFEHVGLEMLREYFTRLLALLPPGGRVLNHGISRPEGEGGFDRGSFIDHYVFPDGELHEVGRVVSTMQDLGLEVRDVHSLREHYAKTLRAWVENLRGSWDECVALAGAGRARVWLLYMAASALNFEAGRTSINQVLAVRSDGGVAGVPLTREAWA
jgi:cyclopropane-fatty-acyl-phospholipid synthase